MLLRLRLVLLLLRLLGLVLNLLVLLHLLAAQVLVQVLLLQQLLLDLLVVLHLHLLMQHVLVELFLITALKPAAELLGGRVRVKVRVMSGSGNQVARHVCGREPGAGSTTAWNERVAAHCQGRLRRVRRRRFTEPCEGRQQTTSTTDATNQTRSY